MRWVLNSKLLLEVFNFSVVCSLTHCNLRAASVSAKTDPAWSHTAGRHSEQWATFPELFHSLAVCRMKEGEKAMLKVMCSVGGQCTEKAHVSWLIVGRGFGGHSVFHNDMEQLPDMHARGHPLLSLLIPDSSFSPEPRHNHQTRPRRVDGRPRSHARVLIDLPGSRCCHNLLCQMCFEALKLCHFIKQLLFLKQAHSSPTSPTALILANDWVPLFLCVAQDRRGWLTADINQPVCARMSLGVF